MLFVSEDGRRRRDFHFTGAPYRRPLVCEIVYVTLWPNPHVDQTSSGQIAELQRFTPLMLNNMQRS